MLPPPPSGRRRWPATVAFVLIALLGLVLAACSVNAGAPDGSGVATLNSQAPADGAAPSPSLSAEESLLAYARCMREHGIDMPDPEFKGDANGGKVNISLGNPNGSKIDKNKMDAAEAACGHFMQNAPFGPGGGQMDQATQDALLAFAKCMREHGINMPDPQFTGGGAIQNVEGIGSSDKDSAKFQEAQQACQDKLPGGGPNASAGPGIDIGTGGGGTTTGPATNSQP
jgi:hypothetical protein